ncbi:MAG: NADPH:quinone oxidoreductase family protein [Burkholderiales bacterium]|nr:NADPH:quinone oxidoreductase family protein [Burkholderiales bacterium]
MYAWVCNEASGPQALRWSELPTPEPAPGEVRIAVACASLNFPDLLIVQGKYQVKPALPFVPGCEFSGVITAVGSAVTGFQPGDRVAAFAGQGGFATEVCVPAHLVMPVPAVMSFEDAAAFICTYATSHHGLIDRGSLRAGETVLVLGATGGVGSAAMQVAKAAGARVIAGTSSPAKCELALRLGADAAFDYSNGTLRDRVKELTGGKGPDIVYDPVGGPQAEVAFRAIAWRGRYLVIGFAQGQIPSLPLNLALLKGAAVVGVFWGEYARREPKSNARMLGELSTWYAQGLVKPYIDQVLHMTELPAAFELMDQRRVHGKLVLRNTAD